jgi:hypothetical protein
VPKQHNITESSKRYSIEAQAYDIVGMATHNFWVLRDEVGNVLGQLHGLATNPQNEILPIGKFGDKLKFYHFGSRAIQFGLDPESNKNYIKANQKNLLVYTGTDADVLARWDNAVKALPFLNRLEIPYTPFGVLGFPHINSNTAFSILGKIMDIPALKFQGYWQPGWGNAEKILTSAQFEDMKFS